MITNEQWLCGLTTTQKAKFLKGLDCGDRGFSICDYCKKDIKDCKQDEDCITAWQNWLQLEHHSSVYGLGVENHLIELDNHYREQLGVNQNITQRLDYHEMNLTSISTRMGEMERRLNDYISYNNMRVDNPEVDPHFYHN